MKHSRFPGGICGSYYLRPGQSDDFLTNREGDPETYRFEFGGGHWIFGGDPAILSFIKSLTPAKSYERKSGVYFPDRQMTVPYPLQNHLGYFDKSLASKALTEITGSPGGKPKTMEEWIGVSFGKTLTDLFFGPFHQLYTAGLWSTIAPQDPYKSPINLAAVISGAIHSQAPAVGYNIRYLYPQEGLNRLAQSMASRCQVNYQSKIVAIHPRTREAEFSDGRVIPYQRIISTFPLNTMIAITGLEVDIQPDPYTSVLVLNIGGGKGPRCPTEHWLYIPKSRSGFHRVGFYSNVDKSFLPASDPDGRVSIYVERAYPGGVKPDKEEIARYSQEVVSELKEWQFIENAEVVHPTWIDVAYTWSWPGGSNWRQSALTILEQENIFQVGRYGRWIFQGIADSIRDGFFVGAGLRTR